PHAEAVLAPAAHALLAAVGGERVPVAVDFGLGLAGNLERDRLGELEVRAAVQAGEGLAHQLELDGDGLARPGQVGGPRRDPPQLRIGEQGDVEPGRLFGLAVEPEEGVEALHGLLRGGFAPSGRAAPAVPDTRLAPAAEIPSATSPHPGSLSKL